VGFSEASADGTGVNRRGSAIGDNSTEGTMAVAGGASGTAAQAVALKMNNEIKHGTERSFFI
jgi:hypothetical protein